EIEFAPDNNFTFLRADATGTTWTVGGVPVAASALTLPQAFAVEDRILHYVDKFNPDHNTFYKGFAEVQNGKAFVTSEADAGLLGNGSIQRAVDVVDAGGTVNVEAGTYTEDVSIDRAVSLLGPNVGVSAQTGFRSAEAVIQPADDNNFGSVVVAVNADNVRVDGFTIRVNRDDASGGIAASHGAISDIGNLTGGSFNNLRVLNNIVSSVGVNVGDFDLDPVSTLPATSMGIAVIGMGSATPYTVTIQGNRVVANAEPLDPTGISAFTRGIYLGSVQGSVGGASVSQGNSSAGFAQDLLVQFAGGATSIRNNRFTAAGVDISSPAAPVTLQKNTFAPEILITSPAQFPSQSLLIRDAGSPVTVNNNVFDDFHRGIVVEGGRANITANSFTNISSPFGVDQAGLGDAAVIVQSGAVASIIGNNFGSGINAGVDVDGGIARIQGNVFGTDLIGVLVENGGQADIGQGSGAVEFAAGLGTSTGGNDFSAYSTPASTSEGAIVVLKDNAPNDAAGPQGVPNDTPAVGNTWSSLATIADVVYDDADDSSVGLVLIEPSITGIQLSPGSVLEGGTATLTGTIESAGSGSSFDLLVNWGDGSTTTETVTPAMISAGTFSFNHVYEDDNPTGSSIDVYHVTVQIVSGASVPVTPTQIFVSNVAPSFAGVSTTPGSVNEGGSVSLQGTINDPGLGDTFVLNVNWGDGTITTHNLVRAQRTLGGNGPFDLSLLGISHTYADDAVPGTSSDNYTVTLSLADDDGGLASASTIVVVNNLPPVATDDGPVSTPEDSPVTISVLGNDSDPAGSNDTLSVSSVTNGTHGTVTTNGTTVTYTPAANYVGTDSFTYTISDGDGGTDTATVSVEVTATDDPPVANDDAVNGIRNAQVVFNVLANDSDPEGDALSVTAINGAAVTIPQVIVLTNGTLTLTANNSFAFSPNSGFTGTQTFEYTLTAGSQTDTATVTITIAGGNSQPIAQNDTIPATEDQAVSGNVLANNGNGADSDPDNDLLTTVLLTTPAHGSVVLLADGNFTYTPNQNYTGSDSFKYRLLDSYGGVAVATVTLNVANVNDAPTVTPATFTVAENSLGGTVVGSIAVSDVDSSSFTYSLSGADASLFEIDSNGQITVASGVTAGQLNFEIKPSYTFTATASDGSLSGSADVTVNLSDVAEAGPTIKSVRVGSSAWASNFRNFIDTGDVNTAGLGYQIPKGGDQTATLPWFNLNQIIVEFSEDVSSSIDLADFALNGVAGVRQDLSPSPLPSIQSVTTSGNFVILTLNQSIEPAAMTLTVFSSDVTNATGDHLDGEWATGSSNPESGNGTAGGNFTFEFNVLPGNMNTDEVVDGTDTSAFPAIARNLGSGSYSVFRDFNGDARQNGTDKQIIVDREGSRLRP
ncbi:MAG: beta strand repeat-containing protein, partial [Aureliella sp.]